MLLSDLQETNDPGYSAREIFEGLIALGHTRTRVAGPRGSILECRVIDGKPRYFVAAEQAPKGVSEFKMYAEPEEMEE